MVYLRSLLLALVAGASLTTSVSAKSYTPAQIITQMEALKALSNTALTALDSATEGSELFAVFGQGPLADADAALNQVRRTADRIASRINSEAKINGTSATDVASAWHDFTLTHQKVAEAFTSKAGIYEIVPVLGRRVATTLKDNYVALDLFAIDLNRYTNKTQSGIITDGNALVAALTTAAKAYQGILARDVHEDKVVKRLAVPFVA